MLDLLSLKAFVKAVEVGSLTAAGRHAGMTVSGVGKAITRLEDHLGVRLLNRTTRSLSLTPDGASFYERCRGILAELEEAELAVTQGQLVPRGRLVVDMPLVFARRHIIPALPDFLAPHPELAVAISFDDKRADLMEDGLDVAIRLGEPPDTTSLVARRLADSLPCVCAAPADLGRYGRPQTPEDLGAHNCLTFIKNAAARAQGWSFQRGGHAFDVAVSGNLSASRGQALVDAAVAGVGIVKLPDYFVAAAVEKEELQVCLAEYALPGTPVSILYPRNRHLSLKVRAFVDFAAQAVSGR